MPIFDRDQLIAWLRWHSYVGQPRNYHGCPLWHYLNAQPASFWHERHYQPPIDIIVEGQWLTLIYSDVESDSIAHPDWVQTLIRRIDRLHGDLVSNQVIAQLERVV